MNVDPREVEMMARFRSIMEGTAPPDQLTLATNKTPVIGNAVDPQADMKSILEAFNRGASQAVTKIKEEAVENREIRDALITKKTQNGVQMGPWEIKAVEDSSGLKTYDVYNVHTGDPIAMDLTLYESALSITKLLNFHVGINSPQIRKVLEMEDQYARYRQDAAMFKHRVKQRSNAGDEVRAAIAEDRYQESRASAMQLREKIQAFCKTL